MACKLLDMYMEAKELTLGTVESESGFRLFNLSLFGIH